MHLMLFPQNPQTASFCLYKDDNESEPRWISESATSPSPCSPAQQVVSSLCLVCLLALAVAWVIALNMQDRWSQGAYKHTSIQARTNKHVPTPASRLHQEHRILRTQLLPEELRDARSFSLQPLRRSSAGTEGWINRKSMGRHGVRMQGYFPNYEKCCS